MVNYSTYLLIMYLFLIQLFFSEYSMQKIFNVEVYAYSLSTKIYTIITVYSFVWLKKLIQSWPEQTLVLPFRNTVHYLQYAFYVTKRVSKCITYIFFILYNLQCFIMHNWQCFMSCFSSQNPCEPMHKRGFRLLRNIWTGAPRRSWNEGSIYIYT